MLVFLELVTFHRALPFAIAAQPGGRPPGPPALPFAPLSAPQASGAVPLAERARERNSARPDVAFVVSDRTSHRMTHTVRTLEEGARVCESACGLYDCAEVLYSFAAGRAAGRGELAVRTCVSGSSFEKSTS